MDLKVEFISEFIYTKFLFNYIIFKMRESYIYPELDKGISRTVIC